MMELVLHLMDVVENSTRAGADVVAISLEIDTAADTLCMDILDNGRGMDAHLADKAVDPFATTKPGKRTGLGLPLLKEAAVRTGGTLEVKSALDEGTHVCVRFGLSHIDRQPVGDLVETLAVLLVSHPETEFVLEVERDGKAFSWQSLDIEDRFGSHAMRTDTAVLGWVRESLQPVRAMLLEMDV